MNTDVTFPAAQLDGKPDVELAGTLSSPDTAGPFRAALILAGSGPLDRNGNMKKMRLNVSQDLAALVGKAGWASLRFDKRGVGSSGGDYLSTGFFDELADAEAAYLWLRARPEIGAIVVIGHSAGSLMAVELARRHPDLAGIVLLATTSQNGEETLRWQTQQMGDHIVPPFVSKTLGLFGTSVVKQQEKAVAKLKATTTDTARIQMAKVNAKWMREFIAYDPEPVLGEITVPVLAITGTKDVQVNADDLAEVAAATGGAAETLAPEDVDHILRHEPAPISNPRFYRKQLDKPIDPRVTGAIERWLDELPARASADGENGAA